MKKIGVITLVVIMILFVAPLIQIKDKYTKMEYEEIGNVMLGNINEYIKVLDNTSQVANVAYDVIFDTIDIVKNTIITIRDFVVGIFEHDTDSTCIKNPNGTYNCDTSLGGGGGTFGGGSR